MYRHSDEEEGRQFAAGVSDVCIWRFGYSRAGQPCFFEFAMMPSVYFETNTTST